MCGTPAYLAPEVINQQQGGGYTNLVDSWSLGVMVFSMSVSFLPCSFHSSLDECQVDQCQPVYRG